jgi:hypothetical protein
MKSVVTRKCQFLQESHGLSSLKRGRRQSHSVFIGNGRIARIMGPTVLMEATRRHARGR